MPRSGSPEPSHATGASGAEPASVLAPPETSVDIVGAIAAATTITTAAAADAIQIRVRRVRWALRSFAIVANSAPSIFVDAVVRQFGKLRTVVPRVVGCGAHVLSFTEVRRRVRMRERRLRTTPWATPSSSAAAW